MSSRQVPPYDSIPSQQKPRAILNHYFSGHVQGGNDGPQFMPFSQLPSELRLEVWKHFLRRHRLINIRVGSAKHSQRLEHPELESTYSITNTLGNTISAANYRLHVDPGHRRTSLFWVNHEARQAALKFYRIRIPCDIETCEEKRLLLYLNPEFDFLQIFPDIVPNNLVHFIYDLKAYDPLGVGVVNLGIHDLYSSSSLAEARTLESQALSTFRDAILNLKVLFFHQTFPYSPIITDGPLTRIMTRAEHLSYPQELAIETFDMVGADPRPIELGLDHLRTAEDLNFPLNLWKEMEQKLGIRRRPSESTKIYFLLTMRTQLSEDISGNVDANKHLRKPEELDNLPLMAQPVEKESLNPIMLPAFGFWMISEEDYNKYLREDFTVQGLLDGTRKEATQYKPNLCLYELPSGW